MERLLSSLGNAAKDPRIGGGDSYCDRLNNSITVTILVVFALMVTAKFYVGEPISCWCPGHFEDSHVSYTNKVCWTTNTYSLPIDEEIPKEDEARKYIGYYQWVSLILALQAVLFYTPRPIWNLFSQKSGIAVCTITDAAIEVQQKTDSETRDKTMKYMVKHMGRFLLETNRKRLIKLNCFFAMWYGNSLVMVYIVVKLLYIGNILGQLFMLNAFLDTNFNMYGIDILQKMARGEEWTSSDRFPRITLCNIKVRMLGNVHPYTVQCSLPMNLFNEMVFIFMWFWFVFVLAVTVGSLLMWLYFVLYVPNNNRYIKTRLVAMDKVKDIVKRRADLEHFVSSYLRRDGCFVVRMVSKNSSDVIAAEMLCGLWDHFLDNKQKFLRLSSKYANDDDVLSELNS